MTVYFSMFSAKARNEALAITPEPSRLIIGREPLKNAKLPLREDYLYFGKVSELPAPEEASSTNLLLLKDVNMVPALLERNRTNIILANEEERFEQLCEEMHTLFDMQMQVNNFADQLLHLVQDEAETEELLNLGYQFFGNPLLIFDSSLCLLYSSGADAVEDDPVLKYAITKGYMPDHYLEEIMKEESTAPIEDKVLIIWEKDFLKNRVVAGRIVRGNRLMAYLKLFESNRPIDEVLDIEMFRVLCRYLALSMETNMAMRQPGTPFIETFLLDIIERKLVDPVVIQERADLYNLEFHENMVVIVVEMEEQFLNTDKLFLLKQMVQNLFKRNTVLIHDNDIVILYDRDVIDDFSDNNRLESFDNLLEKHGCRAAVSMPFKSLYDLHTYYFQAVSGLHISHRLKAPERILRYGDLITTHMLLRFSEVFSLYDLIPPAIWELRELDIRKGSNLTETLFCYINHHQDFTSAAKAMHIHYNTLKYRIDRIVEASVLDLDNPKVVFQIMLAEQVLELLEKTDEKIIQLEHLKPAAVLETL